MIFPSRFRSIIISAQLASTAKPSERIPAAVTKATTGNKEASRGGLAVRPDRFLIPGTRYFGQPRPLNDRVLALWLFVTELGNLPPLGTNQTSTRRICEAVEAAPTEDWQKPDSKPTPFCSTPGQLTSTCVFGIARQTPVPAVITAAAFWARFSAIPAASPLEE
jgi:hypothetical protein